MSKDVFDLQATLGLDSSEYEKGIDKAKSDTNSFVSGLKKAGAVAGVALGAAAVGVGVLAKKSVDAYAEYEQLTGGVKKLYGTASDELMKYANNAYKTSGMSANQYMNQATNFSAALVNSLNGDFSAAAKQTDVAMRAISDNFNTFGGDIEGIQNAFQGFAKQNYTMLDNLKLGYGGTKTEMERLIADANKYAEANGMAADLSIDSFSDIVTAIDLIQQKQGIAGTTAKEAATTIEGSLNMTKSAWDNLLTGLANPDADIGKLVDNLVVAIVGENEGEGLLNQIIPALENALNGIGQLLEKSAPIISSEFPTIINNILPPLLGAAATLISGLVSALPGLVAVLIKQMPAIIKTLVTALTKSLPQVAAAAPQIILTLATGLSENLSTLIPAAIDMVLQIVDALLQNADLLVTAAVELMAGLAVGLVNAIPVLIKRVPTIIKSLVTAIVKSAGTLSSAGIVIMKRLQSGVSKGFSSIPKKVSSFAKRIPSAIKSGVGNLMTIGKNMIDGLWNGIKSKFDGVVSKVKSMASKLPKAVKKVLGISSPSKVFAEIGKWIPEGLALGIEKNMKIAQNASNAMANSTASISSNNITNAARNKNTTINIYSNVTGSTDPEAYAQDLVGKIKLAMRTA